MRVLVLTSSFPRYHGDPSGVFLYHLGVELRKLGVYLEVLAPHHPGAERNDTWDGIRISRFPYFYPLKFQKLCYGAGILKNVQESPPILIQLPFFILSEILHACRIIQKGKFDLVHAHWSIPQGLTGLLVKKLFGIPCLISLHGSDVYGLKTPLLQGLNSRVIRRSNACAANSRATAKVALELAGREDIQIIPMGVDIDFFSRTRNTEGFQDGFDKKEQTILFAGRLIEWKGVDYLIKAFAQVLEKRSDVRLLILGSGPRKSILEDLSKELNIQQKVEFHDAVCQEELVLYYSRSDVFVLPSIVSDSGETEGLGVVLLEAMAGGLPVIGTRVGGIPDIIKDGETGLLAQPRNPGDLAHKIEMLLADKELRQRLGKGGHDFVKQGFSWRHIAAKYLELFELILKEKGVEVRKEPRC